MRFFIPIFILLFSIEGFSQRLPDLIQYRKGNQYGYVDSTKKIIVPPIYDWVELRGDSTHLIFVFKFKKYGAYNKKGELVIPVEYTRLETERESKYIKAQKDNKFGIVDSTGKILVPVIYDEIDLSNHDIVFAKRNSLWGTLRISTGQEIIPCMSQMMPEDYYGFYKIASKNKYGLISNSGKIIIPTQYWDLEMDAFPFIAAKKDKKSYKTDIYDTTGKILVKNTLCEIEDGYDTLFVLATRESIHLMGASGNVLLNGANLAPFYSELHYSRDLKSIRNFTTTDLSTGLFGEMDMQANIILKNIYENVEVYSSPQGTVFCGMIGDTTIVVDSLGKTILESVNNIYPTYFYDHFIIATQKFKAGVIDYDGKTIVPFIYKNIQYLPSAHVFVCQENKGYGLLDSTGKKISDARFSKIDGFENGVALVNDTNQSGGMNNLLDSKGHMLLPEGRYDSLLNPLVHHFYYDKNTKVVNSVFARRKEIYTVNHSGGRGLISESGKILIPDTFFSIEPLRQNLYKVYLNDTFIYRDYYDQHIMHQYAIYDSIGNRLTEFYDYIADSWNADSAFLVKRKGKQGFLDFNYKVIFSTDYYSQENADGFYLARSQYGLLDVYSFSLRKRDGLSGKAGYLKNLDNKMFLYQYCIYYPGVKKYNSSHQLIDVRTRMGIIDSTGKIIIPPYYDEFILGSPGPQYITAVDSIRKKHYFYFDGSEVKILSQYDEITSFGKQRKLIVTKEKKQGIITLDGQILIPIIYDRIIALQNGDYSFWLGEKCGIMDSTGKIILQPIYAHLVEYGNRGEIYNPSLFSVFDGYDPETKQLKFLGYMDIHGTQYWEE